MVSARPLLNSSDRGATSHERDNITLLDARGFNLQGFFDKGEGEVSRWSPAQGGAGVLVAISETLELVCASVSNREIGVETEREDGNAMPTNWT